MIPAIKSLLENVTEKKKGCERKIIVDFIKAAAGKNRYNKPMFFNTVLLVVEVEKYIRRI